MSQVYVFCTMCVLRAADLTMSVQLRHRLLIFPGVLHQLSSLADELGPLAPAMKVCLTFGWFGMLSRVTWNKVNLTIHMLLVASVFAMTWSEG